MRTLLTLLLIAFGRAEVRPLLKLRAGAVVVGQPYNAEPVRREDVVVRPAERSSPLESLTGGNEDSMSDAERVYVLQQFAKPAVRTAFIRKVYAIVATQLAVTAAIVAALRMSPALLSTLIRSLGRGLFVLPIVPLMLLSFMPRGRQASSPLAYALLALFTVLQGAALGVATWPIPVQLVVRAATASAVAVGGLSAYALTTRRDFTTIGGMLVTAVLGMLSLGLLQFFMGGDVLMTARAYFGVLVFGAYIIHNTQLMMGGSKRRQLRPDEHIMAALSLYTDIINFFLHVLQAMASDSRD